ncbi:hypothetical protein CSPX01_00358, partial [Colletotrichum filicis]
LHSTLAFGPFGGGDQAVEALVEIDYLTGSIHPSADACGRNLSASERPYWDRSTQRRASFAPSSTHHLMPHTTKPAENSPAALTVPGV